MHKVFIGSTSLDLHEYRAAAIAACIELEFFPVAMEHFEAMGEGATRGSKRKLDGADLYVGIFAFRYGYIEPGYDRSVTEIEFDYAGERGLERLCFLADPDHPWPVASMDRQHLARLDAFKDRISTTLIRAKFTTPEDFKAKLLLALVKWRERHPAPPSTLSAVLAESPDELIDQPDPLIGLIGRDDLKREIAALLTRHKRVLLQGLGGMGKTALAATVAAEWIAPEEGGKALWISVGEAEPDVICNALAVPFKDKGLKTESRAVAKATGDAKLQALYRLLAKSGIRLLVLDDVWNGSALAAMLKAVPRDLPVLITARQIYPKFKRVEISGLDRADSLELLKLSADAGEEIKDAAARELCELLGDHPFALCLAGDILETVPGMTSARLLERIQDKPFEMSLSTDEQRTFKKLLQASLDTLDSSDALDVFYALGAMAVPSVTEELLALYLSHAGRSVDTAAALELLSQRGLVDVRVPQAGRTIYRMHRLVYSVARADFLKTNDHPPDFQPVRDAVCEYTRTHKDDLPALDAEINNILGVAEQARVTDAAFLVDILLLLVEEGTYTEFRGYTERTIDLLSAAIEAAKEINPRAAHFLVGKRGDYYDQFVGQKDKALADYHTALQLSQQIGDASRQAIILTTIGTVHFDQGAGDSETYHQQAFDLATAQQDEYALMLVKFNRGIEEFSKEEGRDLEAALRMFQEAGESAFRLIQAGQATTRLKKVHYSALLNSGACQNELGRSDEAIITHQQAYEFAEGLDNHLWMAYAQQGLGEDHDMLHHHPEAEAAFNQAYRLMVQGGMAAAAAALKEFMDEQGYTLHDVSVSGGV